MRGVAIQEAIEEMPADSEPFDMAQGRPFDGAQGGAATDDQTPPEEMDPQAVSPRQRLALEAFCKGGTIGDAAKAANVSRQTLHRWRAKYPHFALAMSSWSSACLSTAESQLVELASRAVGALSNAIDKGDARTATAVLRSLGVLRTYQPSKAPAGNAEKPLALPGMNFLAQALAESTKGGDETQPVAKPAASYVSALRDDASVRPDSPAPVPGAAAAGEEARPAAANSGRMAAKQNATETRRPGREPAGVLRHQDVTSEPAKAQKPAILAGKAGSAIKIACDSALQDVTECYQMLPNGTGQNALPRGVFVASCA
jgi:transposase-like protein